MLCMLLYIYGEWKLQWVVSVQWNYFYELEYLSLMVVQVSLNGLKRCTKICNVRQHNGNVLEFLLLLPTWYVTFISMRSKCAITKISTPFAHYRNGLHHQHRARSYSSCVSLSWLNGVTQYWSRNLCGFAYHRSTV
ncbi:hypothetical protein T07_277 [Trichinella nelsoni]|uniref:Uncharacterized protein n=1 Tax=Trichinella nelsoni TaxID=6336 RepID=A0A0V0SI25_9BILA|nr:hypothetical protein T07_277 [Trichinella nelsoni]